MGTPCIHLMLLFPLLSQATKDTSSVGKTVKVDVAMMALVQFKASPAGRGIEFSRCVQRERQLSTQFEPSRKIFPHTAGSHKGGPKFYFMFEKAK